MQTPTAYGTNTYSPGTREFSYYRARMGTTQPPAPVNVRLVMADGSLLPVDTIYAGTHAGMHVWRTVRTFDQHEVLGLRADEVPAKTEIRLSVRKSAA